MKSFNYICIRLTILSIALMCLLLSTRSIVQRKAIYIPKLGIDLVVWDQVMNYRLYGFEIGFLSNMNKLSTKKPAGYSEETIKMMKRKYERVAIRESTNRHELGKADYNIIIVLDECFFDVSIIKELYPFTGPDAIENYHSLMKHNPNGYMYSPEYGGGTANVEFEVYTGLSNYWVQTLPYTYILPRIKDLVSIAKEAKKANYTTTAIHSYYKGLYKRDSALHKEGFDRFISLETMKYKEHDQLSPFVNDRSVFQETLDVLKGSNTKQLITVLTMQNHNPYLKKYFRDNFLFDFNVSTGSEQFHESFISYLQSLYSSDKYLGDFINQLSGLNQKIVMLFFGDHAPGIFSEAFNNHDNHVSDLTHLTPYFIWSNFKIETTIGTTDNAKLFLETFRSNLTCRETSSNKSSFISVCGKQANDNHLQYVTLPTTSPNCLTSTFYDVLNLQLNAERELLREFCAVHPILAHSYLKDSSVTSTILRDYELFNYDLQAGRQYWLR